jgi:hypothetical protein
MKKTMRETSWRTLMLLTTLFIVFVIFQGTVRTPKLPVATAQPSFVVHPPEEPNQPQEKPAPIQPEPVITTFAETRPVWLHDNLGEMNGTDWSSESETEDESPEESGDPNQAAAPVE